MPLSAAMAVLDSVYLVRLTGSLCQAAGSLAGEFGLPSLDVLHLAVAVSMRNSIHGVITYDQRFAEAASKLGFVVEAP
jgi:predicted nucleic acid-binding protein